MYLHMLRGRDLNFFENCQNYKIQYKTSNMAYTDFKRLQGILYSWRRVDMLRASQLPPYYEQCTRLELVP